MKFLQNWRIRKPEEDSESVYISEKFGVRTLHIGSDTIQSAMRLARPNDLEVAYTRSMMACLLFNAVPREFLMIGLGGGSLAKFVYHRLPLSRITVVEINPRVLQIARQYFQLPADNERFKVEIADGAAYVATLQQRFDVILLDGYDAEAQVEALATLTFYRECARLLGDSGILVVNLWGGDRGFTECVDRLGKAFDGHVACMPAGKPGNIAALAFKQSPGEPEWEVLRRRAQALQATLGLEFPEFVKELKVMNRHDAQRLLL